MICKIQKKTISRKVGKYPGYNNQAHTMVMICWKLLIRKIFGTGQTNFVSDLLGMELKKPDKGIGTFDLGLFVCLINFKLITVLCVP